MRFIKVTRVDYKDTKRYININDIKAVDGFDGHTNIYVGDPAHFKVKETPDEIFRLISEVLEEEDILIHEGLHLNNKTITRI